MNAYARAVWLAALLALAVALPLLWGCGEQASPNQAPEAGGGHENGLQGVSPSSESASQAVSFTGANDPNRSVDVSVQKAKYLDEAQYPPFEDESAFYGVYVTISNVGQVIYDDDVYGEVELFDNERYSHSWTTKSDANWNDLPEVLDRVHLWPGESISGWVYFRLDPDVVPASFRFTSSVFDSYGEWRLE